MPELLHTSLTKSQLHTLKFLYPSIPSYIIIQKQDLLAEILAGRSSLPDDQIESLYNRIIQELSVGKLKAINDLSKAFNLCDPNTKYWQLDEVGKRLLCDSAINAMADGYLLAPMTKKGSRRKVGERSSSKFRKLVKLNRKLLFIWGEIYEQELERNLLERLTVIREFGQELDEEAALDWVDLVATYPVLVTELKLLIRYGQSLYELHPEEKEPISVLDSSNAQLPILEARVEAVFQKAPKFFKMLFIATNNQIN